MSIMVSFTVRCKHNEIHLIQQSIRIESNHNYMYYLMLVVLTLITSYTKLCICP